MNKKDPFLSASEAALYGRRKGKFTEAVMALAKTPAHLEAASSIAEQLQKVMLDALNEKPGKLEREMAAILGIKNAYDNVGLLKKKIGDSTIGSAFLKNNVS